MSLFRTARLPLLGAAIVALLVPLFLVLHTGPRATALCERSGAANADGLTLLPLGVRCSPGSTDGTTNAELHPVFFFAVLFLVGAVIVVRWNRTTTR